MSQTTASPSVALHDSLDHPIVDGDGHWVEFSAAIRDFVRDIGGPSLADRFANTRVVKDFDAGSAGLESRATTEDRRDSWINRSTFWGFPTKNTRDRATSMLPALIYERLDEMGIDVSIMYPSLALTFPVIRDPELRQVACRAFNTYAIEAFRPYSDRLIPVAVIPMETPGEAIAELEHAITNLGFKAAVLQQWSNRGVAKIERQYPDLAGLVQRPDFYGLDSEFDYDPVWAKCVELGIPANFHAIGSAGTTLMRGSISNSIFNRLGMFQTLHARTTAAMFLGGVTRRFPTLNIGLLEGGVAWATSLYADLVGLWSKRNVDAIGRLDPQNLDRDELLALIKRHGDDRTVGRLGEIASAFATNGERLQEIDEFENLGVSRAEDLEALFSDRFYFGCEGDDPLTALAYRSEFLPFESPLRPFYGSDISHWDVVDMAEALHEAHEGVDDGLLTPEQFRAFAFENPVRLHGGMNPDFFRGTIVESAAAKALANLELSKPRA